MNTTKTINHEYSRKIAVAQEIASSALRCGGVDCLESELRDLYYLDADPLVISEVERLYHRALVR